MSDEAERLGREVVELLKLRFPTAAGNWAVTTTSERDDGGQVWDHVVIAVDLFRPPSVP
jgi:hypothetical protein